MPAANSPFLACLASGSQGNCSYVGTTDRGLLVDAGITLRQIRRRLEVLGVAPAAVEGVLLTHEHGDHVSALTVMQRHWDIPLYGSEGTLNAVDKRFGGLDMRREILREGEAVELAGLRVIAHRVIHDAAEPFAYRLEGDGASVGYVTDMGKATPELVRAMQGVDLLYLESNHDPEMLRTGPYPGRLKRRVASDRGHASNEQAAEFLAGFGLFPPRRVVLGHLSETNNRPQLALASAMAALRGRNTEVHVASQGEARLFATDTTTFEEALA